MYTWKKMKSLAAAREECRQWNKYENPMEHLWVIKTSQMRPRGIRKTQYNNIYYSVKGVEHKGGTARKRAKTTKTKTRKVRRTSSSPGLLGPVADSMTKLWK